jgi:hypothetical protein
MIYVLVSTTRVNRAADTLPIILTFDVYGGGRELGGGVRLFEEQRAHYHMCANKEMPTAPTSMPAAVYRMSILSQYNTSKPYARGNMPRMERGGLQETVLGDDMLVHLKGLDVRMTL